MRRLFLLSCTVAFSLASAAHAADVSTPAPAPAPALEAPSWTGFYVGAFVGYRSGEIDATECGGGGVIGQNCATNITLDGVSVGFTAGYDYEFANGLVLGAFAAVPVVPPTATATTPLFAPFGISWDVEPQYALYVGGRLGYAMGDVMPYVVAGASWARVTVTPQPPPAQKSSATHVGAILGGGVEVRLTENISLDGRYLLGLMGEADYEFCGLPGCRSSYDEVSHNVALGVNYRF